MFYIFLVRCTARTGSFTRSRRPFSSTCSCLRLLRDFTQRAGSITPLQLEVLCCSTVTHTHAEITILVTDINKESCQYMNGCSLDPETIRSTRLAPRRSSQNVKRKRRASDSLAIDHYRKLMSTGSYWSHRRMIGTIACVVNVPRHNQSAW